MIPQHLKSAQDVIEENNISCTANAMAQNPMLHRVYYEDTYLDQIDTEIIRTGQDEYGAYFIPKQTIFHPKGGGQPDDQGYFSWGEKRYLITHLMIDENEFIKHYFTQDTLPLQELDGEPIILNIDLTKRKMYARLHSAGHLIANLVEEAYSGLQGTKGNHFPDQAAVTFTIAGKQGVIPNRDDFEVYDFLHIKTYLENKIFDMVAQNLPLMVNNHLPRRTVQIAALKAFPCGGTHVNTSAEIGQVIIKNVAFRNKEGVKISYEIQ